MKAARTEEEGKEKLGNLILQQSSAVLSVCYKCPTLPPSVLVRTPRQCLVNYFLCKSVSMSTFDVVLFKRAVSCVEAIILYVWLFQELNDE